MRIVTRKTIDRYLVNVPVKDGGWQPIFVHAIPIFPKIPIINPNGPAYVIYGKNEEELLKRRPSIDYFYLCRRANGDSIYS